MSNVLVHDNILTFDDHFTKNETSIKIELTKY